MRKLGLLVAAVAVTATLGMTASASAGVTSPLDQAKLALASSVCTNLGGQPSTLYNPLGVQCSYIANLSAQQQLLAKLFCQSLGWKFSLLNTSTTIEIQVPTVSYKCGVGTTSL
jgi:hypothetical protein